MEKKYIYVTATVLLHETQVKIISLSEQEDISNMSLRQIGNRLGLDDKPQLIKHHLNQLVTLGVFDYVARQYVRHKFN